MLTEFENAIEELKNKSNPSVPRVRKTSQVEIHSQEQFDSIILVVVFYFSLWLYSKFNHVIGS